RPAPEADGVLVHLTQLDRAQALRGEGAAVLRVAAVGPEHAVAQKRRGAVASVVADAFSETTSSCRALPPAARSSRARSARAAGTRNNAAHRAAENRDKRVMSISSG